MLENLRQIHSKNCTKSGKCYLVDTHQLSIFVFLLTSGIFSSAVMAEDTFTPYVDLVMVKDDNLYRLDSDINVNALSISKEDTIYQAKAGLAVDWALSRQKILGNFSVTDNRFENNSNLDYAGQDLDLKWNWLLGSYLTGQLGWNQSQTLNDFSNTNTQASSKKDQQTLNFLAKWRYAPDWEMGVKLSDYDLSYELQALQASDRKSVKKALFWNYITHAGNRVGMTWQREDGEYPGRELTALSVIDPKYQQDSLLLNVVWQVTVKSKLSADIGWNGRTHPTLAARDYDGFNTKVAYAWFPTAKTMLDVSLFRQLVSSNYVDASFSENSGYALSAAWRLSEKLSFNGMFKHETRDYVGQVNGFKERYDTMIAGVTYQPYSMLDASLRLNQSLRDSTQLLRDYQSQSITLGVSVKF
jgi:exopolysaccharide biosynthesis operon protein EpsL